MAKVYGIGINDSIEPVAWYINGKQKLCPFYSAWKGMLSRCYKMYGKADKDAYADVHVCEDWLTFSKFREWMKTQDWHGKHLDKDLLCKSSRTYSPETCVFISQSLNKFLCVKKKGSLPTGVTFAKGRYYASCTNPITGVREFVGSSETADSAYILWLERKRAFASMLADRIDDKKIANAIRTFF